MNRNKIRATLEFLRYKLELPGDILQINVDHRNGIAEIIIDGKEQAPEGGEAVQVDIKTGEAI